MQNDTMPQFGVQKQNSEAKSEKPVPVRPSQPVAFGSATENLKRRSFFSNLNRDQILPAVTAIFGFLALIFLVATIALATSKTETGLVRVENQTPSSTELAKTATLMFNEAKISNAVEGATYRFGEIVRSNDGHQVVAAYANNNSTGISFEVNWEFVVPYYAVNSARVDQETFKVATNEVVADMTIGKATNDQKDDVLLLLLADGTVKYMPLRESLEKYSFKVVGEIEEATDVVKFYKVQETINGESIETTMMQKADGTIIDLKPQLLKIVGKDVK